MSKKSPNPSWLNCSRFLSSGCLFFLSFCFLACMYFYSRRHLKFHKISQRENRWLAATAAYAFTKKKKKICNYYSSKKEKQRYLPTADRNLKERRNTLQHQSYGSRLIPGITLAVHREGKTIWLSRDYSLMQSSILLVLLIHYVLLYDLTISRLDQVYKSPIKSDYSEV